MRPGEDGWIAHDGGECAVPGAWIDRVQYRSGDVAIAECRAEGLSWKNDPWFPMLDIVAFRIEAKSTREPKG